MAQLPPLPTVGPWYLLQGPTEAAHKLLVLCHRPRRAEVHATGLRVQGAHALQTVGVAQVAWEKWREKEGMIVITARNGEFDKVKSSLIHMRIL